MNLKLISKYDAEVFCDKCKKRVVVQKAQYYFLRKKDKYFCRSCCQLGKRNKSFRKKYEQRVEKRNLPKNKSSFNEILADRLFELP